MAGPEMTLSFTSIWNGLTTPVLALAEEHALQRSVGAPPAVAVAVRSGGIDVVRGSGAAAVTLASASGRPQAALAELLPRLAGQLGPELAVRFAPGQAIIQQVVLPQQPTEVLRAIVRNKVESLAPWPLAQCLWGLRVAAIADDPQHVAVDVAVVSRALLDEMDAALRQAGSTVTALSVALPDGHEVMIDRGGGDVRRQARARAVRQARAAAALLVVLLGLGAYWVYRSAAEAGRLEAETAALLAAVKPGGAPAGETPLVSAANRLYQARRARLSAAGVLEEVSKLLPDTVHLLSLTLDGDQLTIKGQGSGVPDLIQILEASPAFQSVNFAAATEQDQASKADAFSLIATLEQAPLPGAAP